MKEALEILVKNKIKEFPSTEEGKEDFIKYAIEVSNRLMKVVLEDIWNKYEKENQVKNKS